MTGSAEKGESKGEASPGSRSIAWGWSLIGFREKTHFSQCKLFFGIQPQFVCSLRQSMLLSTVLTNNCITIR